MPPIPPGNYSAGTPRQDRIIMGIMMGISAIGWGWVLVERVILPLAR